MTVAPITILGCGICQMPSHWGCGCGCSYKGGEFHLCYRCVTNVLITSLGPARREKLVFEQARGA
jgi:hypothetical protein